MMNPKTFLYTAGLIGSLALAAVSLTLSAPSFRAHPADEITYIRYASFLNEYGLRAYPRMVETYASDPANELVPMSSPLKAGYLIPAAFFLRFFRDGFAGLAFLSLAAYLVMVVAVPLFLKRDYGPHVALLVAALTAFSPLAMALSRRALTESLFLCVAVLGVWSFRSYLVSRARATGALCVCLLTWAVLIKETAALLSVSFLAYAFFRSLTHQDTRGFRDTAVVCVLPILAAAGLTYALGRPGHVTGIISTNLFGRAMETNPYDIVFCSGPWYRPLLDFLILSPGVFILGIAYYFTHLVRRPVEADVTSLFFFLAVIWIMALSPFAKNVRYAVLIDLPLRLGAVLMLKDLLYGRPRTSPWLMTAACVVFLAATDYARFWTLFVDRGMYDPVTPLLLQAVRILP